MRQLSKSDEGLGTSVAIFLSALGAFSLVFGFLVFLIVKGQHYPNPGLAAYRPPPGAVLIPARNEKRTTQDLPVASFNQPKLEATHALAQAAADTDRSINWPRKPANEAAQSISREREAQWGHHQPVDRMTVAN